MITQDQNNRPLFEGLTEEQAQQIAKARGHTEGVAPDEPRQEGTHPEEVPEPPGQTPPGAGRRTPWSTYDLKKHPSTSARASAERSRKQF